MATCVRTAAYLWDTFFSIAPSSTPYFIRNQFEVIVKVKEAVRDCLRNNLTNTSLSPSLSLSLSFSHQLQLQFRFQFQFQFHYDLWPLAAVQQADKVNRKPKIITMPAIINIHFDRLIVWSFFTSSPCPPPLLASSPSCCPSSWYYKYFSWSSPSAWSGIRRVLFCSALFCSVQTYQNFEMLIEALLALLQRSFSCLFSFFFFGFFLQIFDFFSYIFLALGQQTRSRSAGYIIIRCARYDTYL